MLEAQIEMSFLSLALDNDALRELQHEEFERFWDTLNYRVSVIDQQPKPGQVPPRQRQPSDTGGGDGLEHRLLVVKAAGLTPGAPGPPHAITLALGNPVPVAAAHEARSVDPLLASRHRAATGRQF
jgi:hypothetical protein